MTPSSEVPKTPPREITLSAGGEKLPEVTPSEGAVIRKAETLEELAKPFESQRTLTLTAEREIPNKETPSEAEPVTSKKPHSSPKARVLTLAGPLLELQGSSPAADPTASSEGAAAELVPHHEEPAAELVPCEPAAAELVPCEPAAAELVESKDNPEIDISKKPLNIKVPEGAIYIDSVTWVKYDKKEETWQMGTMVHHPQFKKGDHFSEGIMNKLRRSNGGSIDDSLINDILEKTKDGEAFYIPAHMKVEKGASGDPNFEANGIKSCIVLAQSLKEMHLHCDKPFHTTENEIKAWFQLIQGPLVVGNSKNGDFIVMQKALNPTLLPSDGLFTHSFNGSTLLRYSWGNSSRDGENTSATQLVLNTEGTKRFLSDVLNIDPDKLQKRKEDLLRQQKEIQQKLDKGKNLKDANIIRDETMNMNLVNEEIKQISEFSAFSKKLKYCRSRQEISFLLDQNPHIQEAIKEIVGLSSSQIKKGWIPSYGELPNDHPLLVDGKARNFLEKIDPKDYTLEKTERISTWDSIKGSVRSNGEVISALEQVYWKQRNQQKDDETQQTRKEEEARRQAEVEMQQRRPQDLSLDKDGMDIKRRIPPESGVDSLTSIEEEDGESEEATSP